MDSYQSMELYDIAERLAEKMNSSGPKFFWRFIKRRDSEMACVRFDDFLIGDRKAYLWGFLKKKTMQADRYLQEEYGFKGNLLIDSKPKHVILHYSNISDKIGKHGKRTDNEPVWFLVDQEDYFSGIVDKLLSSLDISTYTK